MSDIEQPRFQNFNNSWIFLGQFEKFDLYTDGGISPNSLVIVRFGDEPRALNVVSSRHLDKILAGVEELKRPELKAWEALKEAFRRAKG